MLLAYSNLIEVDFIYCHILPFIDACIRYLTVFLTVYNLKGRVQQLLQQFSRRKESRGSVSYVQNYFHNVETFTLKMKMEFHLANWKSISNGLKGGIGVETFILKSLALLQK